VLQNFSEILQKTIRKTDSIGRYGGDEFVLVLPETRPDQAQFLIKRIQKCLSKNQPLKSLFVRIKFSFGISNLIYKNDTVKKLLVRADKNLYQLKRDTSRKY
jgi:diguanylate cyclase (GGDEF)-like protein